jgi:hypothetical protein
MKFGMKKPSGEHAVHYRAKSIFESATLWFNVLSGVSLFLSLPAIARRLADRREVHRARGRRREHRASVLDGPPGCRDWTGQVEDGRRTQDLSGASGRNGQTGRIP